MKLIIKFLGELALCVIIGAIVSTITKLLGASDFASGMWTGMFMVFTSNVVDYFYE